MHDKKRCSKCKFHGYFGSKSYKIADGSVRRSIICEYAKHNNETCLHNVHGSIVDRRGTDPKNCQLFENNDIP